MRMQPRPANQPPEYLGPVKQNDLIWLFKNDGIAEGVQFQRFSDDLKIDLSGYYYSCNWKRPVQRRYQLL